MNDLELRIDCPTCSARAGEDCSRFGYCPARIEAARKEGDSDTQPDPYIDAMAAEHAEEYEPMDVLTERTCPHCQGTGSYFDPGDCPRCNGNGTIAVRPVPGAGKGEHPHDRDRGDSP